MVRNCLEVLFHLWSTAKKKVNKKQRPSVRSQFVFNFYNFLPMSRSGYFSKVSGLSIFRGLTSTGWANKMLPLFEFKKINQTFVTADCPLKDHC